MSTPRRIHMARPVDPHYPEGPARAACGAVLRQGEALTDERAIANCPQCGWISQPRPVLVLRVDDRVPLTPAHRLAITRAYHQQLAETGEAELGLGVGEIELPIPPPKAPAHSGTDLAGLRDRARWIFLDRANRVQGEDAALRARARQRLGTARRADHGDRPAPTGLR